MAAHGAPDSTLPPALAALNMDIPPELLRAFRASVESLRSAMQDVGLAAHIRPPPGKSYRGAAIDSKGILSSPHTSRRVLSKHCKLAHLHEALDVAWPDAAERGDKLIDADLVRSINFALTIKGGPKGLVYWRREQQNKVKKCSKALTALNTFILRNAVRPTAAKNISPNANIAFIACLVTAMDWPDKDLAADICYGFPLVGSAQDSGLFRPLYQRAPAEFEENTKAPILTTNYEHVLELVKRVETAGLKLALDDPTAKALAETTRVEREEKRVIGDPFDLKELFARFPLWYLEDGSAHTSVRPSARFGVWQNEAMRAINDFKQSLVNACWNAAETIAPPSVMYPIEVVDEIVRQCDMLGIPVPQMRLALDDVAHAYKRCAVNHREMAVICLWDNASRKVVFVEQWGLPFGAVASVTGFCRIPQLLTRAARTLFATFSDHYVDDAFEPDFKDAGDSAQVALGSLFKEADFEFSAKKRKAPADVQEELGVICDMSAAHTARVCALAPKEDRCDWILAELDRCSRSNRLTPGNAKSVKGKLSFLLQSLFGRIGRAMTLPLVLRCHEKHGATHFSTELEEMKVFLDIILAKGTRPCRQVSLGAPFRPHVLIWTDASDDHDYRGLGLVAIDTENPAERRVMAADVCPPWLLKIFKAQCSSVICVLEMLAGLCGLISMGEDLRGRKVYLFCDNTAAWSSMITGYSSSKTMARISALFHLFVAALDIDLWVEWVNTDANIADLPSRPAKGRGDLSKITPPLIERPMNFICQKEYDDPALFFKKWRAA